MYHIDFKDISGRVNVSEKGIELPNECLTDAVKKRRKVLTKKQGIEGEIIQQATASSDVAKLRTAMEKDNSIDVRTTMQHIAGYAPQDYATRISLLEKSSGRVQYKVGESVASIKPGILELDIPGGASYILKVEASPAADVESAFNAVWLGIEASGKTSLIERIRQGEFVPSSATIGLNVTSFVFEGMKLVNCDLSGHKSFRSIWDSLVVGKPDLLVYVVDASDSSTINETRDVLKGFVSSERLKKTPLLILYNKVDVDGVLTVEKLNSELGLSDLLSGREWKAIQTSAKSGAGISDLLEWILQQIKAMTGVSLH